MIMGKEYVYISGAITGTTDYEERFAKAKEVLQIRGFVVCNPLDISAVVESHNASPTWADYMKVDIRYLCVCESIYMLKGWQDSRGAKLEHHIAQELGMKIYYEEEKEMRKSKVDLPHGINTAVKSIPKNIDLTINMKEGVEE